MKPTIEQLQKANNDYSELRKFITNKCFTSSVIEDTAFLESATIKQRLYHILNDISNSPTCKCGTHLKWNIKNNSYRTYCSSKCAHTDDAVKSKTQKTCLEKFGVRTNLLTKKAQDNYSSKMLEKYGVDNPFKSKQVQQQIKDDLILKYGVDNISKLDSIKEKINATHVEKYGRFRSSQSHVSEESYLLKYDKQALVDLYTPGTSIQDIADKLKVGHSQLCIQFKNMGIELHQNVGQQQVCDFIKSRYNGNVIVNDRKILEGKEIDIFIPELKIGFEYDGIFWHSENSSGKTNYHIEKDALARSKEIKLYHILDLEWKTMRNIVESRILSIIGSSSIIYGRNTTVATLDKQVAGTFFNQNHIQGNAGARFYSGLFHNGELTAAMSFAKSRYNSSEFELIRFCNKAGTTVIGGASKLFKFSINALNAKEVISFCDLRWGTGNVYEKLGFKFIRNNPQSYIYTNQYKTLESRIKYQKHKLEKILPRFDSNLSEWENMKKNGYDRYWNSGNAVYLWTKAN